MPAKPYNGHPSWNAWNVSLWIGNDEALYRHALDCIARYGNGRKSAAGLRRAARAFVSGMPPRTPDGARYSIHSVSLALAGLAE